ncbi:unnamed protein product, partial [marine sediment metagenome]
TTLELTYAKLLTTLGHELGHLGVKNLEEIEKLLAGLRPGMTFRGLGGVEFPEELLDSLRPGMTIRIEESGTISVEGSGGRPFQCLAPSTQDAVEAYLIHMEDGGAADGYTKVRARKLRYFARQHPELPTDPEVIRAYLRQFRTDNVPTRLDQWKALSALYKFASDTYDMPNSMLKVDKPRFRKKSGQRLSRDQARLLLTAIETDLEWALVTCYFGLRFRRVEAERLRLGDVKSDYLIVQGKERTEELPLLPFFRDQLLRLQSNHHPSDRLFP